MSETDYGPFQWLFDALQYLQIATILWCLGFLERVIYVFPATGAELPGNNMPALDMSWVGSLVDIGALNDLVFFIVQVEAVLFTWGFIKTAWGFIKW